MDSSMEEKLGVFSKTLLNEAHKISDETEDKINKIITEKTEKKKDEFLEDAYRTIQGGIAKIRREESERVLRAENDMKREILKCREEIIDKVFSEAAEKLSSFAESDKYPEYFKKKLSEALLKTGEGEKVIYALERDLPLAKESGFAVEAVSDQSFMGGVRVLNKDKGIIADYSFGEALSEEKSGFLQKSGLSI